MPSSEQIRESIEARIGELRNEMASLETARAALQANVVSRGRSRSAGRAGRGATKPTRRRSSADTNGATSTATPAEPPPVATPAPAASEPSTRAGGRSRKPRRAAESKPAARRKPVAVLFAGTLEAMLRDAKGGLNAVAIAEQARARDSQVRDLLRELERTGRVRRTGVGRARRWTLVTDEERIAQRAAELDARSTPKR